jgi:hypothetical protein
MFKSLNFGIRRIVFSIDLFSISSMMLSPIFNQGAHRG